MASASETIAFLQNWLINDERILMHVDEVLWTYKSYYPVKHILPDEDTPSYGDNGSLVLTNRRLIVIERSSYLPLPRWYSMTTIASLSERPPKYSTDRQKRFYPYQALVTLYNGVIFVFETPKDRVEERGQELSKLLVEALMRLDSSSKVNGLFADYAQQYEEEKRRNED